MVDYISMVERVLSKEINESVSVFKSEIDTLSKIIYNINCGNCDNKRISTLINTDHLTNKPIHN